MKSAEERQAGTYACRVASPSSYFHDAYVQLSLLVYGELAVRWVKLFHSMFADKFILNTTVHNNAVILKLSERKSDNGSYCCKASNALGSNETCITVIVHGSDSQWQDISVYSGIAVGSGLLVLLILSTIFAHVKKKSRERLVYFFARVYFVIDLFT